KQNFSTRINQSDWLHNPSGRDVKVRLGRLLMRDKESFSTEKAEGLVNAAEALLIHALSPAKNSSSIRSLRWSEYGKYHILNWGAYGDLLPEVSGRYYCADHRDVSEYA
ncbi:MAG: hypothetical protein AAFN51_05180, partial [Pseudomonadota bacterium]